MVIELITNHSPIVLALIATGAFAGLLAGLLGVGGGIVIVPVLFFLFQSFGVSSDSAIVIATATSLATIVPTSISSIYSHNKKGNVDFGIIKQWSLFILIGVLTGSWLVTRVNGNILTVLFSVIAILSSLNMLFRTSKSALFQELPGKVGQSVMSFFIGFFSSMVGIGGGTLSVPLLALHSYPTHKAVGTASAIGLIISFPSAMVMMAFGNMPNDSPAGTFGFVNVFGFLCIVPLTVMFAPIGASIVAKLNAERLKKVFSIVLLITGLRMLIQ